MRFRLTLLLLTVLLAACGGNQVRYVDGDPTLSDQVVSRKELSASQQQVYTTALAAIESEEYAQAIKLLNSIASSNETLSEVYLNLSLAYYRTDQFEESLAAAKRAVALDAKSSNTNYMAGLAYLKASQVNAARQAFAAAIEVNPEHAYAHYNLGLIYDIYYQQLQTAIDHYQRYVILIKEEDQATVEWIEQLKGSL